MTELSPVQRAARAVALDDARRTARSVLSELKASGAGPASVAAAGRIVRELEALR